MPNNPTGTDWPSFAPLKRRYPASILPVFVMARLREGADAKVLAYWLRAGKRKFQDGSLLLTKKGRYTITRAVRFRPVVYRKEPITVSRRSYSLGTKWSWQDPNFTCRITAWTVAPGQGVPGAGDYDYTLLCTIPRVSLRPVTVQLNDADRNSVAQMATSGTEVTILEQPGQQWIKHFGKVRTLSVRNRIQIR